MGLQGRLKSAADTGRCIDDSKKAPRLRRFLLVLGL
jgi:hypothetical protein